MCICQVSIYTARDGKRIAQLAGHSQQITCLSWHTSNLLATASYDSNVRLWAAQSSGQWQCDKIYSEHTHAVTAVDFRPTSQLSSDVLVASLDAEGHLRVWSASSLVVKVSLSIAGRSFSGFTPCPLKFSPVSPHKLVAMAMGTVLTLLSIEDVGSRSSIATPHEKTISTLDFSPDGNYLLLASDEKITIWQSSTLQLLHTQKVRMDKISSATFIGNDALAWGEYQALYLLDFQAFIGHAGRASSGHSRNSGRTSLDSPIETSAPPIFENGKRLMTIPLAHPAGSITGLSCFTNPNNTSLICSVSTDKNENVKIWQFNPIL